MYFPRIIKDPAINLTDYIRGREPGGGGQGGLEPPPPTF